jgi:hypothetical protein
MQFLQMVTAKSVQSPCYLLILPGIWWPFFCTDDIVYSCYENSFTSFSLEAFKSASYTHCFVFKYIVETWGPHSSSLLFWSRWHLHHDQLPCWFFNAVEVFEESLSTLNFKTLCISACKAQLTCWQWMNKQPL